MTAIAGSPSLYKRVKDAAFDINHLDRYDLLMQFVADRLRFCVVDSAKNQCLWLEDHVWRENDASSSLTTFLQNLYEDHQILAAGYWRQVRVALPTSAFTLVPSVYFTEAAAPDFLRLQGQANHSGHTVRTWPVAEGYHVAASTQEVATDWLNAAYPRQTIRFYPIPAAFLTGLARQLPAQGQQMAVNVGLRGMEVAVYDEGRLQLCNTFTYRNEAEFVYYLMFVMNQTRLNPQTASVTLWGEVMPDAPLYTKLFRYVRHLHFGQRPTGLTFGFVFDETLEHRFYDLFAMHLLR